MILCMHYQGYYDFENISQLTIKSIHCQLHNVLQCQLHNVL